MFQLKLPLQISTIIETSDPVYSFCEVMDSIDLKKYLSAPKSKIGRKRYNPENLLKVILFAFTEFGYVSVRRIEQLCKTDIRFMWLLQDEASPSHMTIDNFMNETLLWKIEDIFTEINSYIFQKEKCCKCESNRIVRINEELTGFHKEVVSNLNSIHGAYLRMNRSIQAEGAFGIIKWNRAYQRIRRRSLKSVILEISMISCGFNLHKYYLKTQARQLAA